MSVGAAAANVHRRVRHGTLSRRFGRDPFTRSADPQSFVLPSEVASPLPVARLHWSGRRRAGWLDLAIDVT